MKRKVSIIDAMADPALFGPWFKGNTWNPWRAFLSALFGLPMSSDQVALYRKHTGRTTPPTQQFREARLLCGRRAGKSLIAALLAVYLAVFRDYSPYLAPGELATMMVIAADRRQARVIMRFIKGFVNGVPMLAQMISRETRETLELSNRVVIEIHTASFRTLRGYTCGICLNDEECFWAGDETSAEPASEIIAAERPSLITIPSSILLSLSSPHARRGPMYEAAQKHFGKDDSPVLFWKATTLQMNPSLDPKIVADAYERDPVAARSEYDAEFRSDCETFISHESISACVIKGRIELPRETGVTYIGFVDPSGGSSDSMTLAIAHKNEFGQPVLDLVREVKPPFSPERVVREFAQVLSSYGLSTVTGDNYAGTWPKERFSVYGVLYQPSQRSRSEIYLDLLPLLNSRRSALLDNQRLISQLSQLERHASRSGSETIDHAPGGHDDLANAAAGALVMAASRNQTGGWGLLASPGRRTVEFR